MVVRSSAIQSRAVVYVTARSREWNSVPDGVIMWQTAGWHVRIYKRMDECTGAHQSWSLRVTISETKNNAEHHIKTCTLVYIQALVTISIRLIGVYISVCGSATRQTLFTANISLSCRALFSVPFSMHERPHGKGENEVVARIEKTD